MVLSSRTMTTNVLAMVYKGMLLSFSLRNLHSFHCRFGMYDNEGMFDRNPFTGATSDLRENEFTPMGYDGFMGPRFGDGYGYDRFI